MKGVDDCVDFDECSRAWTNDCASVGATCENLDGSYECSCNEGFRGDGFQEELSPFRQILNWNEFLLISCKKCNNICAKTRECSENGHCKKADNKTMDDFDHLYSCVCNQGYQGDGYTCSNINECLLASWFFYVAKWVWKGLCELLERTKFQKSIRVRIIVFAMIKMELLIVDANLALNTR